MRIVEIDLSQIEQNENSRAVYKWNDLSELMASMKKDGLLQPVGVRKLGTGKYEAVYGNRRLVAAKKLEWNKIPCVVVSAKTDDVRDILNLVENIKRQNTTLPEDGRAFLRLRDMGLSDKEIGARLGISVTRVETAIKAFSAIPKEYRKYIVNPVGGKPRKGTITASQATSIINLQKNHNLSKPQVKKMLKAAKDGGATVRHFAQMAPLMKAGCDMATALKQVETLKVVELRFFMTKEDIAALEAKYGSGINQVLISYLMKNKEFGIMPDSFRTRSDHRPKKAIQADLNA